MSERYLDALWRVRHELDAIEAWLATLSEHDRLTMPRIQQEIRTPPISYAQAALAVNALVELGILEKQPGLLLNRARLLETEPLRTGMRLSIDYTCSHMPSPPMHFLVALPAGLPTILQEVIAVEASDLRSGLIGLLADAQEHLLLAAPFWDETTMTDLGNILERRLNGGIRRWDVRDQCGQRRAASFPCWGAYSRSPPVLPTFVDAPAASGSSPPRVLPAFLVS